MNNQCPRNGGQEIAPLLTQESTAPPKVQGRRFTYYNACKAYARRLPSVSLLEEAYPQKKEDIVNAFPTGYNALSSTDLRIVRRKKMRFR